MDRAPRRTDVICQSVGMRERDECLFGNILPEGCSKCAKTSGQHDRVCRAREKMAVRRSVVLFSRAGSPPALVWKEHGLLRRTSYTRGIGCSLCSVSVMLSSLSQLMIIRG